MVDITVDNNIVSVEGKKYNDFNDRQELVDMLSDVIERVKYSGETVSLWVIRYDGGWVKKFVKEWP